MIRMSSPYDLIGVFLFIMIGIYKITSPSNKIYIGQSIDIEKRFMQYKLLRCKGCITYIFYFIFKSKAVTLQRSNNN